MTDLIVNGITVVQIGMKNPPPEVIAAFTSEYATDARLIELGAIARKGDIKNITTAVAK